MAEWALVPLRLFLGFTFGYAGLQKLANPNFFNAQSTSSIQAQLIAAARFSPIHVILGHLIQFAKPMGIVIAFAELAIGVGTLLGLWTRIAALGGAVLSFSLFLAISFHASPFYTGADIVFFFAWLPFIISGVGQRLSVDGWIARYVAKKEGVPSREVVAIPFAQVQNICGNFSSGSCSALKGAQCSANVCPVLLGDAAPIATPVQIQSVTRRTVMMSGAAAGGAAIGTLVLGGATADLGKLIGGAKAPASSGAGTLSAGATTTSTTVASGATQVTTTTGAKVTGTLLGKASQVAKGQAASFTIPSSGDPGIVFHSPQGEWLAYDAVCPHAGCTVGYYPANDMLVCPCHGSEFKVSTGAVLAGPSPHGLTALKVVEGADGNLYLQ